MIGGFRKARATVSALRAVIFDMDGVIADTEPLHAHAYLQVFKSYGIQVSKEQYREATAVDGKSTASWFVELGGDAAQIPEMYRRKDEIYFPLLREQGTLRSGVRALLTDLRESKIPCAVATSARRVNAEFVLDLFGIRHFFAVILAVEDVTQAKPHPEVFLLALERLSSPPGNSIVLEDAPKGIRAAINAGIPVIAIPTSWTRHYAFDGATLVVHSLQDLCISKLIQVLPRALSP